MPGELGNAVRGNVRRRRDATCDHLGSRTNGSTSEVVPGFQQRPIAPFGPGACVSVRYALTCSTRTASHAASIAGRALGHSPPVREDRPDLRAATFLARLSPTGARDDLAASVGSGLCCASASTDAGHRWPDFDLIPGTASRGRPGVPITKPSNSMFGDAQDAAYYSSKGSHVRVVRPKAMLLHAFTVNGRSAL
jgi:hypothetical protein